VFQPLLSQVWVGNCHKYDVRLLVMCDTLFEAKQSNLKGIECEVAFYHSQSFVATLREINAKTRSEAAHRALRIKSPHSKHCFAHYTIKLGQLFRVTNGTRVSGYMS